MQYLFRMKQDSLVCLRAFGEKINTNLPGSMNTLTQSFIKAGSRMPAKNEAPNEKAADR